MRHIELTQGKQAIVDDADYALLSKYKWCTRRTCNGSLYAVRTCYSEEGSISVPMHRVITSCPDDKVVDHVNHNGLDNRRENLRVCTVSQNAQNSLPRRRSSKFKGVHWHTRDRKWVAKIKFEGKSTFIGCFTDEVKAARAYDIKAIELHGEFACPNFDDSHRIAKEYVCQQ